MFFRGARGRKRDLPGGNAQFVAEVEVGIAGAGGGYRRVAGGMYSRYRVYCSIGFAILQVAASSRGRIMPRLCYKDECRASVEEVECLCVC